MKTTLKKLTLILLLIAGGCAKQDVDQDNKSLANRTVIGKFDKAGEHLFTADVKKVSADFTAGYNITKVEYLKVYKNPKGIMVMESAGYLKNGNHIVIGQALDIVAGRTVMPLNKCQQTCTSVAPCQGCALTILGDCSGYCDCNGSGGSCTHGLSTID